MIGYLLKVVYLGLGHPIMCAIRALPQQQQNRQLDLIRSSRISAMASGPAGPQAHYLDD